MKISLRLSVFSMIFLMLSSSAFASVWNGAGADTLASTASNWTGSTLPPFGDDILLDNTSTKNCTWDLNEGISFLTINGDYIGTVNVTSPLIITNNFAGKWNIFITDNNENNGFEHGPAITTFTQTGNNVFVAPDIDGDLTATFSGLNITMTNTDSGGVTTTYIGTISPDGKTMSGTESTSDGHHSGTWRAIRTFANGDLEGTWDALALSTGVEAGWTSMAATIDTEGSVTVTSYLDSTGDSTLPPPGSVVMSIDDTGNVSMGGADGMPSFHGNMSSNKTLIIGTDSFVAGAFEIIVFRKRVDGVSYSDADIKNISFAFHELDSNEVWYYGEGYADSTGQGTVTSYNSPSGVIAPPGVIGTLQIDSVGRVTMSSDPSIHGLMTPDKKVIFTVSTGDSNTYVFNAFLVTGQTFTTADLAGTYYFHGLNSSKNNFAAWWLGTNVVDTYGSVHFLSYLMSNGSTTLPADDVLFIDAGGVMTKASNASFHGRMSFNKDLYLGTQTDVWPPTGGSFYSLRIGIK